LGEDSDEEEHQLMSCLKEALSELNELWMLNMLGQVFETARIGMFYNDKP